MWRRKRKVDWLILVIAVTAMSILLIGGSYDSGDAFISESFAEELRHTEEGVIDIDLDLVTRLCLEAKNRGDTVVDDELKFALGVYYNRRNSTKLALGVGVAILLQMR